jgi:hypothetical protein
LKRTHLRYYNRYPQRADCQASDTALASMIQRAITDSLRR